MATTIVGRVNDARDAEGIVQDLASTCKCNRADISLLNQNGTGVAEDSKAGSGTLKGIVAGIIIGGIAGYVAAAAAVPVPTVFAKVIASPVASAIMGAFIGSVACGLIGALIGAVTSGEEPQDYPGNARHPGTMILVHARDDQLAGCAVNVMRQHGVMDIGKRSSSDWNKQDPSNRSMMADPLMRTDPKLSAGNPPVPGSPGLRSNRPPEASAKPAAQQRVVKVVSREGWITRKYTATYYGPERRIAANQTPYQGAERRQSA